MMNYFKENYMYFRPLLEELLKLNIDFSKEEPDQEEIEIIKKWMSENLCEDVSAMGYGKDLFDKIVTYQWQKEVAESLSSTEDYSGQGRDKDSMQGTWYDISSILEKCKKEKQGKGVVWVLVASGAVLDGHVIESGESNRYASDNFREIMDALHFSEEAKKIYKEDERYRFNALENPVEFLEGMECDEMVSDNARRGRLDKFCEEQIWREKYDSLKRLFELWIKNQSKKILNKKIDYAKYRETLDILKELIPTVSAKGIVKTIDEYMAEREIVERDLYNYYKAETIGHADGYLQECMEGNRLVENFENVVDRIHGGNFTKMQKDFLMERFLEYIDSFYGSCRGILRVIENFQQRCAVWHASNEDYEHYRAFWNQAIRYIEEGPKGL